MKTESHLGYWYKVSVISAIVVAALYLGRPLFVPLFFGLWISIALYPVCIWLEQHRFGRVGAIAMSLVILTILFAGIAVLLIYQFASFLEEWPRILAKLSNEFAKLKEYIFQTYQITDEQQARWMENMLMETSSMALPFLKKTIIVSSTSTVLLVLIPFYSALILFYRDRITGFLYSIFKPGDHDAIHEILHIAVPTYYKFIKGMVIVYILVAALNSIGLALLGIPHPILFGIIASVLTIIPYVGIMIGALLPIAIAWITYDSIFYPLGVIGVFVIVQYLEANVIFPVAVSNRLDLNLLVSIIAIIAGGLLWGLSGMILFLPMLGMLKLVAQRIDSLKPIAILLGTSNGIEPTVKSEKGKIEKEPG